MKSVKIYISTAVLFLLFSSISFATPFSMFTMPGNDSNINEASIEDAINSWFSDNNISHALVDLDFYAKVDASETSNDGLTVSYDGDDSKIGSWDTGNVFVEFFSVKAGSGTNGKPGGFAFYWLGEGGATFGNWNTDELGNKGLSHLSVWNSTPSNPVPEPATMLLFGIGLIGLTGVNRRKK